MIDRITSGQRQFDAVLGGGFPRHAINLIAGSPGTGKTMLAQQHLFQNSTSERPGLYLVTTTEPFDKIIRFGSELRFFDAAKVGSAVIYESVAPALAEGGLPAANERILELIRDIRPGILVIDSFRAFAPYAENSLAYREFVSELAGRVSPLPISTFWVGEYDPADLMNRPEAAVADSIILLRSVSSGLRTSRHLQVLKLRGGDFLSGEHAYRLSDGGLQVFPRLADPVDASTAPQVVERVSTGIEGLDRMLGGGLFQGSTSLVVGPSGAGKTMIALEFLRTGAEGGVRGVFGSLQENPAQLARILHRGDGTGLDGQVAIHRRSPVDILIDEWVHELLERIDSLDARYLVIDSLSDLRVASPDPKRFEEFVYSLTQRLATLEVTTIMTMESPPSLGFADLPGSTISHLADNIILLGYEVDGSMVRRGIHILKARASDHDHEVRELRIGDDTIAVLDPMPILSGAHGGRNGHAPG